MEIDGDHRRRLGYHDLPEWMKDNDYLLKGYRPPMGSLTSCVKSVFGIHTETVNIWTHLLGCGLFVLLAVDVNLKYGHIFSWSDVVVFGVYFASVISCLGLSTTFHVFNCHSRHASRVCRRCDYCGISILISGSCVSWSYYAFYTDILSKTVYLSIVSIVGLTVALVSLLDKFGSSDFRSIRATTYIIFGLTAALPTIHYFFSEDYVPISFPSMVSFGFYYILGGVIYALRIPEKLSPGRFDIVLHSHQIFHVLIVLAAWTHLENIQEIAFLRIKGDSNPGILVNRLVDEL